MKKIERTCPAKVNLFLKVLGKRPDGFHELETVMQTIDLFDTIEVSRVGSGLELHCDDFSLPTNEQNLMVQAAQIFLSRANIKEGLRLQLVKRIPVAAGLGGGSSDAANTLLALSELFGYPIEYEGIKEIAAQLGSDVPFFLKGGTALCRGRGEIVEPIDHNSQLCLILINPQIPLSTAEIYKSLPNTDSSSLTLQRELSKMIIGALINNDLSLLERSLVNDLESVAIKKLPLLAEIKEGLKRGGLERSLVSGSGPTVFALVKNCAEMEKVKFKVQNMLDEKYFFCAVRSRPAVGV